MDENYHTIKNNYCSELLENIQRCLIKCKNNKKIYYFNSSLIDKFNILDCRNISDYEENLMFDTKIKFKFLKKQIKTEKNYTIEYDIKNKLLILDQP